MPEHGDLTEQTFGGRNIDVSAGFTTVHTVPSGESHQIIIYCNATVNGDILTKIDGEAVGINDRVETARDRVVWRGIVTGDASTSIVEVDGSDAVDAKVWGKFTLVTDKQGFLTSQTNGGNNIDVSGGFVTVHTVPDGEEHDVVVYCNATTGGNVIAKVDGETNGTTNRVDAKKTRAIYTGVVTGDGTTSIIEVDGSAISNAKVWGEFTNITEA